MQCALARDFKRGYRHRDSSIQRTYFAQLGNRNNRGAALACQRGESLLLASHNQGHRHGAQIEVVERFVSCRMIQGETVMVRFEPRFARTDVSDVPITYPK